MRLHEYSVFARFRYNDLKVGISSGHQALKRYAFNGTDSHEPLRPLPSQRCVNSFIIY